MSTPVEEGLKYIQLFWCKKPVSNCCRFSNLHWGCSHQRPHLMLQIISSVFVFRTRKGHNFLAGRDFGFTVNFWMSQTNAWSGRGIKQSCNFHHVTRVPQTPILTSESSTKGKPSNHLFNFYLSELLLIHELWIVEIAWKREFLIVLHGSTGSIICQRASTETPTANTQVNQISGSEM